MEQEIAAESAETPTEASWYYSQPIEGQDGSGVAGTGDVPEWFKVDKYKSVDEQAKAYGELASRFGGFEGSPDSYELPEGVDSDSMDQGMLDITREIGKEYQMSQKMFGDLVGKVNEYQLKQIEDNHNETMRELGPDAQSRIDNVQGWLNTNAPQEMIDMVAPMATNAKAIQALEFFIEKSKGSNVADANSQQSAKMTESEYADMLLAKNEHGGLKMATDASYKKKMDELTLQMQQM